MTDDVQYVSEEKLATLKSEYKNLREEKIPGLAKRIDDARQMGDLSENAEYHAAREDMAWAQSRVKELDHILTNAAMTPANAGGGTIGLSSTVTVKIKGNTRQYTIVGAQEADPLKGKISNESPLGQAFLGKKKGDTVEITVPAGVQNYEIIAVE